VSKPKSRSRSRYQVSIRFGPFRIVVQSFAQLPDAALQDVVGDIGVGSNPSEELIACDDGTVRIDQAKKDFRGFGFHMNTTIAPLDAVTLCSDERFANLKVTRHRKSTPLSPRQHTPGQFRRVRLLLPVAKVQENVVDRRSEHY